MDASRTNDTLAARWLIRGALSCAAVLGLLRPPSLAAQPAASGPAQNAAPSQRGNQPDVLNMAQRLPSINAPIDGVVRDANGLHRGFLTLESLEAFACANNPALQEAAARMQQAQGLVVQAGLPNNWEVGYSGQQVGSRTTQQDGVVVQKEFITGKKLTLQQQSASWRYQESQQLYQVTCQRVLTDVRLRYFEALAAARRLQVSQDLLATAKRASDAADRLLKAQETSRIDLLQSRIEYGQAELNLQRARNRLDAAWRELGAIIGAQDFPIQPLLGDLQNSIPQLDWENSRERILTNSPELAAAQAEVQRTSWNLRRQRAELIPNVTFQGIVQYDRDIQAWDGGTQVTIPLPIANRNQGNIAAASGEMVAAQRRVERIELALTQRLAQVFQRYTDAQAEVDRYGREILPSARENLDLVLRAYQAGEFSFLNVLLAQRTLATADLEYIDALGRLRQAAAEIEGYLLTGSLQINPAQTD